MLKNFLRRYTLRQKLTLLLEEYLVFLIRYIPSYEGMFIRRLFYKVVFKKAGKHSLIWPNVYITHCFNINSGDYLCINWETHIDGRGGIEIGDYVLIGPNVFIGSSNHFVSSENNTPRLFLGHKNEPVKIGSNIWIGANVVICPGVTIGNNSIIGAGSVVTKDVPDSVIVAGNPAIIKKSI